MSEQEFLDTLFTKVEGKNNSQDIQIFTLSTCMWCKKCKQYLRDKDVQYKYIDVDRIQPSQKARIMEFLRENYQERISYPFLICDGKAVVGYDPNKYDNMIKTGAN